MDGSQHDEGCVISGGQSIVSHASTVFIKGNEVARHATAIRDRDVAGRRGSKPDRAGGGHAFTVATIRFATCETIASGEQRPSRYAGRLERRLRPSALRADAYFTAMIRARRGDRRRRLCRFGDQRRPLTMSMEPRVAPSQQRHESRAGCLAGRPSSTRTGSAGRTASRVGVRTLHVGASATPELSLDRGCSGKRQAAGARHVRDGHGGTSERCGRGSEAAWLGLGGGGSAHRRRVGVGRALGLASAGVGVGVGEGCGAP